MTKSASLSERRLLWIGTGGTFAVALILFGTIFARFPGLWDTDSYYHLAISRAYARHGIIDSLPWAQLSLLHEFGDKELLFHLLIAPFSDTTEATAGARWVLALLNALAAAGLAFFGIRAVGRWGLLVAPLIYSGSLDFLSRMIRLRPEVLSLLLLMIALGCAANRRYRALGVVVALYTLGYTAFHVLLGLCFAFFLQQLWGRGRREWGLLLYPLLGVGLGLILHPHFPQNLVVWKVQSLDFFQLKDQLNVGGEITPQSTRDLLTDNFAWWLGLLLLWRSATPRRSPRDEPMADFLVVASLFFGALYMMMQRFSIYFIPFLTLTVLYELRRQGAALGPWTRLLWRGRIPVGLAMAVVFGLGIPRSADFLQRLVKPRELTREEEWSAFGRALPPGARVAAEWGSTHLYMFWAPQATFLNVLDPVFMVVRYPQAYATLRAVFEGREPDIPLALASELGSDYIALSRYHQPSRVIERLVGDPRLRPIHQAYTLLYQVVPDANTDFVLDWRVIPKGTQLPLDASIDLSPFPRVSRADDPNLRALEAYVDTGRLEGGGDCLAVTHPFLAPEAETRVYELAPSGPTKIWLDGDLLLALDTSPGAVLGHGVTFPTLLEPGGHRLTVLTCPGVIGHGGFYLLRR